MNKLLDVGLSVIPGDCNLALAITDTRKWCGESNEWLLIRAKILDKWGSENFTNVVMNIPFAVMSLILSKEDFSKTICMSVNCGLDADCTTATVGAIIGIINPEKWLKPIGRKLVINDGITGITHPDTLDGFTDMIIDLGKKVSLRKEQVVPQIDLSRHILKAECGIFSPWFLQDEGKFTPEMPAETKILKFSGIFGNLIYAES